MWKLRVSTPFIRCRLFNSVQVSSSFISAFLSRMTDHKTPFSTMGTESLPHLKKSISEWQFSSSSVIDSKLPIDPETDVYICNNVKGSLYSRVEPTPLVKNIRLVSYSQDVLVNILDMHPSIVDTEEFVQWVAGGNILKSSITLAHRYGGHQFGTWAGQLGDGRALSLGEYVSQNGQRWDVQLKGSGLTPYSRGGDGRAVLRSTIREFLCSEAMFALGIPTSRAAAMVVSDDPVIRDQFYDGRPEVERAAIVMRIAPSFLRFGSLEILSINQEFSELRRLLNYILKQRPDIPIDEDQKYLSLLKQVIDESMKLVVAWTSVGFTHGVLNTDNMSMFGITIDYGPFGFMESFDFSFTPNSSDSGRRYAFWDQMEVVRWNLIKLIKAVKPLLSEEEESKAEFYLQNVYAGCEANLVMAFSEKLGLKKYSDANSQLVKLVIDTMAETSCDFTMFFRQLGFIKIEDMLDPQVLGKHWALNTFSKHRCFKEFLDLYKQSMLMEGLTDEERCLNILAKNPQYVLRNWMAQEAIKLAEKNDFSGVNFLLNVLSSPYTMNEEAEKRGFSGPSPTWASCIRVSCSS